MNALGVKLMARINSTGVFIELIAAVLLIILLAANITRGPDVLFETQGTGAGHDWGYFGAFLAAVARVRLRDVRLRHGELAGRGDQGPAPHRARRRSCAPSSRRSSSAA